MVQVVINCSVLKYFCIVHCREEDRSTNSFKINKSHRKNLKSVTKETPFSFSLYEKYYGQTWLSNFNNKLMSTSVAVQVTNGAFSSPISKLRFTVFKVRIYFLLVQAIDFQCFCFLPVSLALCPGFSYD